MSLNWYWRDPPSHSFCAASDCRPKAFEVRIWIRFVDQLFPLWVASAYLQCFVSGVKAPVAARLLPLLAIYSCIKDLNHGLWGPGPWQTLASSRLWHWSVSRGHSGDKWWPSKDKYWSWIIKINPDWVHQCPVPDDIYRKIKITPPSVFCVSRIDLSGSR